MTDQEKLAQVRVRISDLGTMLAEVEASRHPLVATLFGRLWAVREIVRPWGTRARGSPAMTDIIMAAVSKAVEALYNLDIKLSSHFVGQHDHPNDQGVAGVRKVIRHALKTLHTANWLPFAEGIDKGRDWKGAMVVKKHLKVDGSDLVIEVDAGGNGNLMGSLQCEEDSEGARQHNLVMEGVERLVMACACAGVPVDSTAFKEALETACEAVGNEYSWDEE